MAPSAARIGLNNLCKRQQVRSRNIVPGKFDKLQLPLHNVVNKQFSGFYNAGKFIFNKKVMIWLSFFRTYWNFSTPLPVAKPSTTSPSTFFHQSSFQLWKSWNIFPKLQVLAKISFDIFGLGLDVCGKTWFQFFGVSKGLLTNCWTLQNRTSCSIIIFKNHKHGWNSRFK